MIERAYNFCCDWCGAARCYLFNNVKDAKHDARLDDWIIYHKDMCFCSKECFNDFIENTSNMTKTQAAIYRSFVKHNMNKGGGQFDYEIKHY